MNGAPETGEGSAITAGPVTKILVGYDGSLSSGAAVQAAASLLPRAHAWIVNLWAPPFASDALRRRLWTGMGGLDGFVKAIEREGAAEAARIAETGAVLARAAGWAAEPIVERAYGGEGLQVGQLAETLEPDLVVVGSRGLGGVRAFLGSVSDLVVHYTGYPVLVVPYPLLTGEWAALPSGPVIVGWDDSPGSRRALTAAEKLFGDRRLLLVGVHDGLDQGPPPDGYQFVGVRLRRGHLEPARSVAEALAAQATARRAAVVVVGSRGRSAPQEILLGSVAMATLHHTFRPVLVVPQAVPGTAVEEGEEESA